jgi:acetoin utilization deacetylase AcuC-like enzyme
MTTALQVVWHPDYEVDIGPHVFPTQKYRLIHDCLLAEQTLSGDNIITPSPATDDQVALVHTEGYVRKIRTGSLSRQEQLTLEVPFSRELQGAMWLCAGGSILTARNACEGSVAVHLGGGFHHAFPNHGEGFCLINDVAIALRVLQQDGTIERAAVIDCDLHHGNGTAAIFAEDESVFTFSIHQQHNYPAWKPPSDMDVGLEDGTGDEEYLEILQQRLPEILERQQPDLIFYLAGADPYREDQLGGLNLTLDGLRRRDALVLDVFRGAAVPVAIAPAGGYAVRPGDTVEIHCGTVREAASHLTK